MKWNEGQFSVHFLPQSNVSFLSFSPSLDFLVQTKASRARIPLKSPELCSRRRRFFFFFGVLIMCKWKRRDGRFISSFVGITDWRKKIGDRFRPPVSWSPREGKSGRLIFFTLGWLVGWLVGWLWGERKKERKPGQGFFEQERDTIHTREKEVPSNTNDVH